LHISDRLLRPTVYEFNKHLLDEMQLSIKPNIDSYLKLRVGGFFAFLAAVRVLPYTTDRLNNHLRSYCRHGT
jgi:hypothetical protein